MKNFCKRIVVFCIAFIIIYTIVEMVLSFLMEIELSPTLTTCVYTFFGTELVSTAIIRVMKEKYSKDPNYEANTSEVENSTRVEVAPDYTPIEPEEENSTAEELIDQLSQIKYD